MEGDEPKVKKRVLPQWMTEDKADTAKKPCVRDIKRKKDSVLADEKKPCVRDVQRKKDRSPRRCTVYCMNEKELVDYALEIIHQSKNIDHSVESVAVVEDYKAESCEDSKKKPQTPPAASCSPKLETSPPKDLASNAAGAQNLSDEEDDPLKYVREIFFS